MIPHPVRPLVFGNDNELRFRCIRKPKSVGGKNSILPLKIEFPILVGVLSALMLTFPIAGCQSTEKSKVRYCRPENLDDGWRIQSAGHTGLDTVQIENLLHLIEKGRYPGLCGLVIARNGCLVLEQFFEGHRRDELFPMYSVTKSISAILTGAVLENHAVSETTPLFELLPRYLNLFNTPDLQKITIQHLLTLTPGFEWRERGMPRDHPDNSHRQMELSDDWTRFILTRPLVHAPGSHWTYSTGSANLLAPVIQQIVQAPLTDWIEESIFSALQINAYHWAKNPEGLICTGGSGGGLHLSARDWAKFGCVVSDGHWQQREIISNEWLEKMTANAVQTDQESAMGYLWWSSRLKVSGREIPFQAAFGLGGQAVYCFPQMELVVVTVGENAGLKQTVVPVVKAVASAALRYSAGTG